MSLQVSAKIFFFVRPIGASLQTLHSLRRFKQFSQVFFHISSIIKRVSRVKIRFQERLRQKSDCVKNETDAQERDRRGGYKNSGFITSESTHSTNH